MIQSGRTVFPMTGIEIRVNPKNGFLVFQCHYTADPDKRDPAYIKEIKDAMPTRRFQQEYCLNWETWEGLSVFADWEKDIHGVNERILPQIGLPLLLGFDWGLTPACIVCQLQEDTLCCLQEFTAVNMGAERFLAMITPQLKINFHQWQDNAKDYLVFIDPAGMNRDQTDEGTCARILDSFGFKNVIPGPTDWEERKRSVDYFLTRRTRNGPCFKVSMPNCPTLTRGFDGGYRYDDRALESERSKIRPKKDMFSHIQDALQMVATRILMTKPSSLADVPPLQYRWTSDNSDIFDSRFQT